ncbi:MAG: hypothetical protein DRP64_13000 [Verrucomicrobia bacterium]|nr:MAG: hypothetical protein DRP64_13000 [Verrucomicrobiota bacterium]
MKTAVLSLLLAMCMMCGCFAGGTKFMRAKEFFHTKPEQELASAIAWNRTGKIEKLLSEGVDVNCRGKDGITPLIWATVKQKKKSFKYLLEHGADPNLQVRLGESAISFAAIMKDSDYLRLVLEHGGNPNLVNPETGDVPIHDSIMNLRKDNIDLLIQHGANLNFQDPVGGETHLMTAASLKQYDVVYKMIKAGADIWIEESSGETVAFGIEQFPMDPEHELYEWRNKVVELLREQGMDVRPWTPEKGPGRELKPRAPFEWEK